MADNTNQADYHEVYRLAETQITQLESWFTSIGLERACGAVSLAQEKGKPLGQIIEQQFPRDFSLLTLGTGILRTSKSILKIWVDGDVDSSYVLARTLVERAVNYAFLNVCDDNEYEAWVAYSRQKSFRLLDRTQRAGTVEFRISLSPLPDPSSVPGLKEDLDRFTGKKSGREITRWTQLSLEEPLAAIEGKFKSSKVIIDLLLQAMAHTYDIGAEAQHGTLLGVSPRFAYFRPPTDTHKVAVLAATVECLEATIFVLASVTNHPEWGDQQAKIFLEMMGKMIQKEGTTDRPEPV